MTRYEKSMLGLVVVGFGIVIWFQLQILNGTESVYYLVEWKTEKLYDDVNYDTGLILDAVQLYCP